MAEIDELRDLVGMPPLPEVQYHFDGADGLSWSVLYCSLREALSELFECTLVLAGEGSPTPDDLFGAMARLTLQRAGRSRHVRGVVCAVEDLGATATHHLVRVHLVPRLWLLSHRIDCRIFQEKTALEIVTDVLQRAGVYHEAGGLERGAFARLPKREYCVQYRESDLDFVMRLLHDEGIPFYFRHDRGDGETLVLVDDPQRYAPVTTLDESTQVPITGASMGVQHVESVQWFDLRRSLRPTGVTLREYDFTRPRATHDMMTPHAPVQDQGHRAQYDYPARYTLHSYELQRAAYGAHDGTAQARIRHELHQSTAAQGVGRSNLAALAPGQTLGLHGHVRSDFDRTYLITRVEHRGQAWADIPSDVRNSEHLWQLLQDAGVREHADVAQRYQNRFEVIPVDVTYRPPRTIARPLMHGAQTARVVGPAGEEIHTDPHGRIKVQFHWDREGHENEHSSCWVRVQQNWAGTGWGFQFIPRIGMEVVVGFLEGDPDRPLVTGCVYNGENGYPYGLPEHKTQSGVKTNSSATNGGYNELRFEDRTGEEQVYVQAQRNMDTLVKRDQTLTVGRNRTTQIRGRQKDTIHEDHVMRVIQNESITVEGNRDVHVHGNAGASMNADATYTMSGGESIVLMSGNSLIVMKPGSVLMRSNLVRIEGTDAIELQGGLVRINCDEKPLEKHEFKLRLVGPDGETPIAGRRAQLRSSTGAAFDVTTDSNGYATLSNIDPQQFEVHVDDEFFED